MHFSRASRAPCCDMDALYRVVTPDFLWSFHDGRVLRKSLAGPDAIRDHLTEQKALFAAQRFHDVAIIMPATQPS